MTGDKVALIVSAAAIIISILTLVDTRYARRKARQLAVLDRDTASALEVVRMMSAPLSGFVGLDRIEESDRRIRTALNEQGHVLGEATLDHLKMQRDELNQLIIETVEVQQKSLAQGTAPAPELVEAVIAAAQDLRVAVHDAFKAKYDELTNTTRP